MASMQEKAQCVLWLAELKSCVLVRRKFQTTFAKPPPAETSIQRWYEKFKATGSVADLPRSGRPRTSDDVVNAVQESVQRSPMKSLKRRSLELGVAKSTLHNILRKKVKARAYMLKFVHNLIEEDCDMRKEFCERMLTRLNGDDGDALQSVILFSDEATFHLSGKVNRHNCRIWGVVNPHEFDTHERNSPKVNVWCAVSMDHFIGPFFFEEDSVNGACYLNMLQTFLVPELRRLGIINEVHFQQDGAPPHFALEVREFLDGHFGERWIGRRGPTPWAARSPDLTPCDYWLWGHVKTQVYAQKPTDLDDLKFKIRDVIQNIPDEQRQNAILGFKRRLQECLDVNGAQLEVWR